MWISRVLIGNLLWSAGPVRRRVARGEEVWWCVRSESGFPLGVGIFCVRSVCEGADLCVRRSSAIGSTGYLFRRTKTDGGGVDDAC